MGKYPTRRFESGSHQKGRPIDRMKAQDILADNMKNCRPKDCKIWIVSVGITQRRDVVRQRVEPYINHVPGIARHRNAPAEAGARDRQILKPAFDEADDLVAPAARRDRIGMSLVIGKQPILPGGKPEEVILLLNPFDLGTGWRLPVDKFALVVERFIAHRIPAGEAAEIDLPAAFQFLPQIACTAAIWRGSVVRM